MYFYIGHSLFIIISKPMRKLIFLLTFYLLFTSILAEDDEQKVEQVDIGIKRTFRLTGTAPFVGHYVLSVKEDSIPKNQDKWYLFAMAEPKQSSTEVFGSPSKIEISKIGSSGSATKIKDCGIVEDSDACFIKNSEFEYKTDKIRVSVHCQKQCEFQFLAEVDQAYPLQLNKNFKLDFEDTAYSKIFTLSTEGHDFYELRILLQPKGFIKYGEPVVLLANYGNQVPSRDKYDLKGLHTWDDGQGIFLRKSEMKERTLTILVEGPQKNVLNLQAIGWQKQQKITMMQYWPQFDYLKTGQYRQFLLPIVANLTHRVKVITFSGSVSLAKVQKVSDEGIITTTSALNYSMPDSKYGQFQFRISKEIIQKQKISKILVRVEANKQSTYVLNFAREEQAISSLLPFISQSSIMELKQTDQYYIKVEELIEETKQKKSSTIELIVGNINGNIKTRFYKCNVAHKTGSDNAKNCEITATNKQDFTEVSPVKFQSRGSEERSWFNIQWLDYVKKTDKDKTQIVYQLVVVLQNANEKGQSSYQIQYKNKDRIYLLKEGELIKDRVFINQKRHYKLSLLDSDATQIRIHCTRISGDAIFKGSLVDPRVNKDFSAILPEYSVITFKIPADQKQTEVFLQVKGLQVSYYSLTTQVIRKSEASPTKKNGTGYNQLIVREQTPYEFVIGAKESIVVQIHATQNTFNLNLKSSASVQVCMTQNLANPPYAPNCEIRNDYFLEMNEILNMDRGLVGNIGIKNNNDFNVTIKLLITKLQKDTKKEENATETSTQTCQLALMNEVMFKLLDSNGKDVEGDIHHCIQYNLNKNAEVQLIVELNKDYQYNEGKIIANINGQQKIQILSPSHIFTKEQVQKACSAQKKHGEPETFCYLKVKFSGLKKTRVRVLAQYTDRSIRLMDGVAHSVHGVVKKIQPRLFYFAVHNYQNVTIVLQNKVGEYKIYANVMKYSEFAEQSEKNNTQIYPTAAASNFQSANPFYYLEQIINIPKDIITQKCKHDNDAGSLFGRKWVDCVILISVGLQGDQEIQKNGKFVIEATQKNRELKENVATSGYLQKKSVAFYHYQNQVPNGTLIVNVNNQNKFCLDIYVKEGTQRASSGSYDKHTKASNTVILNKTAVTSYSITVQANDNCPYTIEVSTAKNNIGRIKKGTFTDINLKLNQQKNFLFENLINETFKILTLHKNGQVIISVKSIPREKLKQVISSDISQTKDWTWSNKDSVRINNNNERNGKLVANPNYCVDCYYLINIKAQRDTEASIIIPTPDTELPITTDSQIKDLLQKNESEIFRIFTESNSQFQIYVQYGKVKISISQSTNKDVIVFDKVFQASKAPVVQPFNLSDSKETYEFLRYSRITIRAEEQSFFSFAIISNSDPEKRSQSGLKYGLPQYLYLQQNKQKCVVGFMTASIDQFLFSFSKADKDIIQNTEIVLRINEKIVKYQKQLGNNEMILNVTQSILGVQASANRKFHLCMKSKKSVAVTVIQSSPLRYWPEKQSIVVKKQSNLTFGAEGRTIIEINQCKSRASAEVFSEFNEMKSTSSIIKQRRRSNNIVQFYGYGAIYIKVKAEKATLKWMTANEAEGKGLGYDEFKSSWIRVLKQGNKIEVTVDPIQYISQKQAHSKLTAISYSFYAAKQEMEMYSSMNCGEGQFSLQTKLINLTSNQLASKQLVKVQFNIQNDLKPKFEKYSYFLVGVKAEVTSTLPNGQTENYRFFYPYQQISKEMLSGSGQIGPYVPEEQGEGSILETIGYALVVIIVFLAIYHVYNKIVKRCRTKRQRVNESMGKEMKYFDLTEN